MKYVSLVAAALVMGAAFAAPATAYESHHSHMMRQHGIVHGHARTNRTHYGVGFGGQHRTTATGGNAGGYSSRN